ncbi:hypothetical protein D3C87_1440500 [compost metagenome]
MRQRRVKRNDSHAQRLGQPRRQLPDRSKAQQAQGLARDLSALRQRVARPLACRDRRRGCIRTAQQHHRGRDHVFGNAVGVCAGGGKHLYALLFAAGQVDVVQADTQPSHHLAPFERREQFAAHLRAVAHDQCVASGCQFTQARQVVDQLRVVGDVCFLPQSVDRGRVHEFSHDDVQKLLLPTALAA